MSSEMVAYVRSAATSPPTADGQLWAGIVAQLRFIAEHRDEWRVYVREAPLRGGVSAAILAEGREMVTSLLADLVEHAIDTAGAPQPPRLEIEVQAHALQGAVEQVANWWEANPDQPLELVALRIMNFAWQGFSNQLEGRFWFPAQ
jgi:hypothetical protein